jgi:flagellar biosynthesis protein FlhF
MNVKRYFAEDMRQALRAVREELGPDAVILSNERVAGGVEILATEDYDETVYANMRGASAQQPGRETRERESRDRELQQKLEAERAAAPVQQRPEPRETSNAIAAQLSPPAGPAVASRPAVTDKLAATGNHADLDSTFAHLMDIYQQPAPAPVAADQELMKSMRSEIDNLRLLLQDQLRQSSTERWQHKNPVEAAVAQRFSARGLSRQVIKGVAERVSGIATMEEAFVSALTELEGDLPVLGKDLVDEGGVVALLGPTGAGKTTTIAKLAIRYALKHGRENLALVTTDCYRVAAYDQLRTLARIIGVPVRRTDEKNSLRKVLRGFRDKSLVLVDMAGFNAGDAQRQEQLASLHEVDAAVSRLLVLPCTSQKKVLRAAYDLVAGEGLTGCVLSKVDEAQSMGEVLSLVLENNLPVAYITNGQAIPDDIEVAQAELLLSYLLYADVESAVHDRLSISESLRSTPSRAASGVGMI